MANMTIKQFLQALAEAGVSKVESTKPDKTCRGLYLLSTSFSAGVERIFQHCRALKRKNSTLRFHEFMPILFREIALKNESLEINLEYADRVSDPELWKYKHVKDTSKPFSNFPEISEELAKFLRLADKAATIDKCWPGYSDNYLIGGQCEIGLLHVLKAITWWHPRNPYSEPWIGVDIRPVNEAYRNTIADDHLTRLNNYDVEFDNAITFRDLLFHRSWIKLANHCRLHGISSYVCRKKLDQGVLIDERREPIKEHLNIESETDPEIINAFCEIFGLDDAEYRRRLLP